MPSDFTPEAEAFWRELSAIAKTRLLNNVWCASCGRPTTMVRVTGRIEEGHLVLSGECERCGEPVARLIEER